MYLHNVNFLGFIIYCLSAVTYKTETCCHSEHIVTHCNTLLFIATAPQSSQCDSTVCLRDGNRCWASTHGSHGQLPTPGRGSHFYHMQGTATPHTGGWRLPGSPHSCRELQTHSTDEAAGGEDKVCFASSIHWCYLHQCTSPHWCGDCFPARGKSHGKQCHEKEKGTVPATFTFITYHCQCVNFLPWIVPPDCTHV